MGQSQSISGSSCQKYKQENPNKIRQQNSSDQEYIDEALIDGIDRRQQIKDIIIYPYIGIGKIIISFKHSISQQSFHIYATGFLITEKHVVTAAHIFKIFSAFLQLFQIRYYPGFLLLDNPLHNGIEAKIYHLDQRFFSTSSSERRLYDFTILQLQQNSIIRKQHVLKCNLEYQIDPNKNPFDMINIPGYPSFSKLANQIQVDSKNSIWYDEKKLIRQKKSGIVQYQHCTTPGMSGAPLLLKIISNRYEIIGLHLGCHIGERKINYGLLLNSPFFKDIVKFLVQFEQFQINLGNKINFNKVIQIQQKRIASLQGSKFFNPAQSEQIKIQNLTYLIKKMKNGHTFSYVKLLDLSSIKMADKGLKALVGYEYQFVNLKNIKLKNNSISDFGFELVIENFNKFCNLEQMNLWNNKITDAGLKMLVINGYKCLNLKKVNLAWNKITFQGWKLLAEEGHTFPNELKIDFPLLHYEQYLQQTMLHEKIYRSSDQKNINFKQDNMKKQSKGKFEDSLQLPRLLIIDQGSIGQIDPRLKALFQNGHKIYESIIQVRDN